MKYKTQFRLAVQCVALMFFLVSSAWFMLYAVGYVLGFFVYDMDIRDPEIWLGLSAPSLAMALGALIFFKPNWIVNRAIPSNKPYCPECGYLLSLSIGDCPECGTALPNNLRGEVNEEVQDEQSS